MSMRHTMKARRALTAVAITTGLVFTVAGCGGGEDDKSSSGASASATGAGKGSEDKPKDKETEAPPQEAVLAEVKGGDDITLTINSAVRDEGGFVTVEGKVQNGSGGRWSAPGWQGSERELADNSGSMAGSSLVDKTGKKKYLVLRDTDGRCLCTQFSGGFRAGDEKGWYAQFPAPPAGTTQVDFQIADMPPATIEITDGE
ncbi:hypothetical protein AR457_13040 [Streptomyces agglomeratus]|uniref:hypothetical protein n=1 Tax=Streptomyces agglomeratus TaxID=285458 RepID=UPI0008545B3F|nr:hypothetical protein [Streptomyces agglomeratus]OEJ44903.1 hypothetical protein AR457_13040 [Streptomyces agglomeratus]